MSRPSDEDFCLIHGRDLMKSDMGNPVAYCEGCERALVKSRPGYESPIIGECDCCGAKRALSRCWLGEMETFACEECRS